MAIGTVIVTKHNQLVVLPAEMHLPESVSRVEVRARGNERIVAPLDQSWDSFFREGPVVSDDFMHERGVQTGE